MDRSSLKGVRVGAWTKGKGDGERYSQRRRISISEIDDNPTRGIGTLSEIAISGRGHDYNPENTFGEPYWWHPDFGMPTWWREDDGPKLRGEPRRWALFCFRFRARNWSQQQGRAAQARGVQIAAALRVESADVRRLAECLRDGRPADWLTPEAEVAARARLEVLGLTEWPGSASRPAPSYMDFYSY